MSTGNRVAFERARKTYLGFLQARGKAHNTLRNYACDLGDLGSFCARREYDFMRLGLPEFEAFHGELLRRGLKPNSRRRKIVTAKAFLRYLSGRMDISTIGAERIVPPEKVERPPRLVPPAAVLAVADAQDDSDIGLRNRAVILVLLETGMLVSEAIALGPGDLADGAVGGALLSIRGKRARQIEVTAATGALLRRLSERLRSRGRSRYFFHGYTRSGPNPERLTARGVEILFRTWAKARGLKHLRPRVLRHLFVIERLGEGVSQAEIMRRLGLRTPYAFRVYGPLSAAVKSKSEATYMRGNDPRAEPVRP